MDDYLLYVAVASVTIASPGPGVVLTISNSLRYGFLGSIAGILGVASGIFAIAILSATSLAVVLSTSAFAFSFLKYMGAAYLLYLGIKMWRSSSSFTPQKITVQKGHKLRFIEGLSITLLNPNPVFFFIAIFPQFINPDEHNGFKFLILVATFSVLLIFIHCLYAASTKAARSRLSTHNGCKVMSKVSGVFFILFGLWLAASNNF